MDRSAYASLSAQEGSHWWFVARRAIVDALIRTRIAPRANARILEAGCGTGGNLAMLARHGTVDALEYDDDARRHANERGIARIEPGMLPGRIGFDGSLNKPLVEPLGLHGRKGRSEDQSCGTTRPNGRLVVDAEY